MVFSHHIRWNIEVNVDDILMKSVLVAGLILDLAEVFETETEIEV